MNKSKLAAFKKNIFQHIFVGLFFILICSNLKVQAQQTIINVPSSEVLPAGDLILKDSNKYGPLNGHASLTPSVTFGSGRGTELSTGVGTSFDGKTLVRGDIAAKKVWFLGGSTRLTVGGMINPYLNEHDIPDTFIYTHLSQRIKKTKTSLTGGLYLNGQHSFPDKAGVLLGLEQVIIPNKLRFALDWLSTPDSYGRMGVGLKYRPIPTVSITSAVIIPNEDSDNIAFNLSFSKFISLKDINSNKRRL